MKCKGQAPHLSSEYQLQNSLCDWRRHLLRWHQSSASLSVQSCFHPFPFTSVEPKKHSLINFLNANLGCGVCFPTSLATATNLKQTLSCDSKSWPWQHYLRRKLAYPITVLESTSRQNRKRLPVIFKLWRWEWDYRLLWDLNKWSGPFRNTGSRRSNARPCAWMSCNLNIFN